MGRRTRTGLLVSLIMLAPACGGGGAGEGGPPPPIEGAREWLAVFETADDPNDLDAADLLQRVDTATVVSPAGCFERGLEGEGIPRGHYVMGVVAGSEDELAEMVGRTGRDPIFTGEVLDVCDH